MIISYINSVKPISVPVPNDYHLYFFNGVMIPFTDKLENHEMEQLWVEKEEEYMENLNKNRYGNEYTQSEGKKRFFEDERYLLRHYPHHYNKHEMRPSDWMVYDKTLYICIRCWNATWSPEYTKKKPVHVYGYNSTKGILYLY